MNIGIISEGKTDQAVISNILKGSIDLSDSDIIKLRPDDQIDETDKSNMQKSSFSNWTIVKKDCIDRILIDDFLSSYQECKIVIHIDSAESNQTGFDLPLLDRNSDHYCTTLYESIKTKLIEWLSGNSNNILFAISIEEIEAWILTIFEDKINETGNYSNPKRKLEHIILKNNDKNWKRIANGNLYHKYLYLSKPFSKENILKDCASRNYSLNRFYADIKSTIDIPTESDALTPTE